MKWSFGSFEGEESLLEDVESSNSVRARDIVSGNKDLNLAFTAVLFNEFPALSMDDVPQVGCLDARVRSMLSCVGAGMRAC